jgi:hypothetical protein
MSLETDVKNALSAIVAIGGPGAPRLYRNSLVQGYVLPAITYFRVDTVFEQSHDSDSDSLDLIHPRFQISCWAATGAAADALARTVRTTFKAWATSTRHAQPVNQMPVTDADTGVHQIVLDFIIWCNE